MIGPPRDAVGRSRPRGPAIGVYAWGVETIYLDHNATTRPADAVADAVDEATRELWANPSSVHRPGQQVRQRIELARQSVATLIGARPREVVFTSGGTESNNLAIRGLLDAAGPRGVLLTTAIEHSAVREPAEALRDRGGVVEHLSLDADGRVAPETVERAIEAHAEAADGGVMLISVQWANNETGVIQPIAAIAEAVHAVRDRLNAERRGPAALVFHVDATQAVGKLPVDVKGARIDLMTFAGHKFHGPKGVGALYVRTGVRLRAVQRGGPQERERRGGTENTPAIVGLGVAADLARDFLVDANRIAALERLRDDFERRVTASLEGTIVNGRDAPRLWNTSNCGFAGLEAEAILIALSEKGVCASAGAACSSGSLEPSPVLRAMGIPEAVAHGSVRFSIGRDTTADELQRAAAAVEAVVGKLLRTLPVA